MDRNRIGLNLVINAFGGKSNALATALRVTPQAVSQWKQVPHGRVIQLERLTGVHRSLIRPDLYPPEPRPGKSRQVAA